MKQMLKKESFKEFIVCIVPIIIVLLMELLFAFLNYKAKVFPINIKSLLCSIIIMYCIYGILCSLLKNTGWAISTMAIFFLFIMIVNQIKISYTGEPLLISDVQFLSAFRELLQLIKSTLFVTIKQYTVVIIFIIICLIAIIYSSKSINIVLSNKKTRIIICLISLILLVMLCIPNAKTREVYLNVFFAGDNSQTYDTHVNLIEYYKKYGVVAGMYGQFLENKIFEPQNYDVAYLTEMLNTAENAEDFQKKMGTPNIIVILSESFWDLSKLNEISFDKEITPNFNRLKKQGMLFEMLTPSYGGMTANVEMELLTGFNLAYYNKGYLPYLSLYRSNIAQNSPSIIKELNNNGYVTKIISCTNGKFYNREKVYKDMGVSESIFLHNVEKTNNKGYYLSDDYLADRIIQELQSKNETEKLFCMALTIQQHMPYVIEKYNEYDINIISTNLEKELEKTVLSYAQGVYDADKQLGKINEYIQTLNEPTIIVFFGDHLPYLKTATGKDVIEQLEYFNTGNEELDIYRKYNTQALVLANYDIQENKPKYISPDLLMPYILNKMDLKLSGYYKLLATTANVLPSYNYLLAADFNGEIIKTSNLTNEMKYQYLLREQLQYMLFIK